MLEHFNKKKIHTIEGITEPDLTRRKTVIQLVDIETIMN